MLQTTSSHCQVFFVATPEELKVQMEEFRSDRFCERAITDLLFWDWGRDSAAITTVKIV